MAKKAAGKKGAAKDKATRKKAVKRKPAGKTTVGRRTAKKRASASLSPLGAVTKRSAKKPPKMPVPRSTPKVIPKNANVKVGAPAAALDPRLIGFAGYPSVVMLDKPGGKAVNQLLWGDWLLRRKGVRPQDGFVEISARGSRGWVKEDDIQDKRLLEIVFVDIGQGDGALVVTPDDEHILVDAGQEDNMFRFLRWKYGKFAKAWTFKAFVISHPDQDHYKGFQRLFEEPNVNVETVYHNGLIERAGDKLLGAEKKVGAVNYVQDVILDKDQLAALLAPDEARGRKVYPNMLKTALDSGRVADIRMLSVVDRHLPGFGPHDKSNVKIDVLGPVPEGERKAPMLRRFDSGAKYGVTKNGHSVVLRIAYGRRTILLGGDLNIPAEEYLLQHHTGKIVPPKSRNEADEIVAAARKVFECDVTKACHHGSADFTSLYLRAVNPLATVISSGDDEPHAHPRADSIGTIGKFSRGDRPLIFSTELARSGKELIKNPNLLRAELEAAQKNVEAAEKAGGQAAKKAKAEYDKVIRNITGKLDRSIAVYGAINLRTDGNRIVMAQRLERASSRRKKWDIYLLEEDKSGTLQFKSKHDEPELE
jgi:beta-lactamase superfamily II metal-dependent hydrolase